MARMLLGHRSLTLPFLLGLAVAVGLLVPAHAEEPMASTLTLTGEPTYADRSMTTVPRQ